MAVSQGCAHSRQDLFLQRGDGTSCDRAALWHGTSVCLTIHVSHHPALLTTSRWVHVSYTLLGLYLLPLRAYTYKRRSFHYFLFDLCYYVTILNFVYIWIFPQSPTLFVACYCLSHGSLASAVITWRNSLVFHDLDKVTSLFVHIYAPLTFTVIRYDSHRPLLHYLLTYVAEQAFLSWS